MRGHPIQRTALSTFGALLIGTALATSEARAFSLTPMSVSFDADKKNSTQSFTVDNSATERIAVQISMTGRKMGLDGVEANPEAEDDFIVYPSQLVLEPNEKRSIRVTWAGPAKVDHELAYRIIAEQLPVETTKPDRKSHAVIKMLLRYMGAVYITPKGAQSHVTLKGVSSQLVKDRTMLAVEVENSGTAHLILKSVKLKLGDLELKGDELKPMLGENVLAGGTRRFLVPWPEKLGSDAQLKNLRATLEASD